MKLYVAICSLSLMAGAGLGYVNGKVTTVSSFVDDCSDRSIVVLDDAGDQSRRHFHCFEIDTAAFGAVPAAPEPEPVPVI